MRGKTILIEGTDCSGKETQANMLLDYLQSKGIKAVKISFPDYDSPTGKIVGGPYLGKEAICSGWFPEKADHVDAKVSALYYAADFLYHLDDMNKLLNKGVWIILDRYFYSTFAHQGGKIASTKKRLEMYKWLETLELDLLGLIDPDLKILLYMPYQCSLILKQGRKEKPDQNEGSAPHLRSAEKAYKEIAKMYHFKKIICGNKTRIKTRDEIHKDVVKIVNQSLM